MKFKIGDKVKIISCSCIFPNTCCKKFQDNFPYMIIKSFESNGKIWITIPFNKKEYKGCSGCSGFLEKDLKLFGQSFKNILEE